MKRRSHKNNRRRLTARERAQKVTHWWFAARNGGLGLPSVSLTTAIQRAIQAAVRQALARKARKGAR